MTDGGRQYWWVACESSTLKTSSPRGARNLDEWVVLFRGRDGRPSAFRDRCLHRCGRLSRGTVREGELRCGYHGWTYSPEGQVVSIPSEGGRETARKTLPRTRPFPTRERDGYVYVRLDDAGEIPEPFPMPHYGEKGWQNLRLVHDFGNNLSNCVENFIDVPHTAYVHRGIFRKEQGEPIRAGITRKNGEVHVTYRDERENLGSFSWFLNPRGEEVYHTDSFYSPNITHVVYRIGDGRRVAYYITSQSVPLSPEKTRVYTDITFRFDRFSRLARPIAWFQAKRVIRQDIIELEAQMEVIRKYGSSFIDSPADTIHRLVSEIHEAIERGDNPGQLVDHESEITFWV